MAKNSSKEEKFLQLPLKGGRAACSFHSSQLVSVITEPPVVVNFEQKQAPKRPKQADRQRRPQPVFRAPRPVIIDDFLAIDEHRDMLAYALASEKQFQAGTVTSDQAHYRQNQVIMDFHESAHSKLICNRLLTWYPFVAEQLGVPLFPIHSVESQLTASNDGHYFSMHRDAGNPETSSRTFTCVYYFFRDPKPFTGGALRLHDAVHENGAINPTGGYHDISPVSNRMVVFPSDTFHELRPTHCPSGRFVDSRFAVTNWIRRADKPSEDATFGWGHLRCGVVPEGLQP